MGANIGERQSGTGKEGVCSGGCKKRRREDKEKLAEKPNRLARIREGQRTDTELAREREGKKDRRSKGGREGDGECW